MDEIDLAGDALIGQIVADQRESNARDASRFAAMVEFVDVRRNEGERRGGRRAADIEAATAMAELSLALTLPVGTIQGQVAQARSLRSQFPGVWAAWGRGEVTTRVAAVIDEAGARLGQVASRARLDDEVLAHARSKTPSQLRAWVNRFVERVEPENARRRHRRALADRAVWSRADLDGMGCLSAVVPSVDLAAIDTRLNAIARGFGSDDDRTMDQRRADIFVDTLLGRIPNGCEGDAPVGASSTTIGVIVPIQSLVGLSDQPGEFADRSGSVPAELIRDEAVKPSTLFWRLLTDERGTLLDASQLGRFPSDRLGFAVRLRDGTSVFPTSSVPAFRCDADHTVAHCEHPRCVEHGPTRADNLGPLDRGIHRLKTDGGLGLRQCEPGSFEWSTRTGRRYPYRADPLPVAEWNPLDFGLPPAAPEPEPWQWEQFTEQFTDQFMGPPEHEADLREQLKILHMWDDAA